MTEDRLAGIAAFVHAVEAGSFARAAARLGQTRSAVAKSIARLERRLGARLFQRTTRTQSLTEDGLGYFEHCRRALDLLAAAEDTLAAGRTQAAGRLRVTAPLAFGRSCVVPALAALLPAHAELDVEIDLSDRVVDLVAEGFDLAVRIGALPDSSALASRKLGTQAFSYYASPSHVAEHGMPVAPADFAGRHGIVYSARGRVEPWLLASQDGQGEVAGVDARLRLDDLHSIADAAIAGSGIARLPRWLAAEALERGTLLRVADAAPGLHADIHAVWPAARHLPARTRIAIDALRDAAAVALR